MVGMCRSCFHHSTLYLGNIFERHRTKINIQKIATCAALVHWVKEEVHQGKISQKLFRLFRAVNKWKVALMGETQETSTQCDLRDALVVKSRAISCRSPRLQKLFELRPTWAKTFHCLLSAQPTNCWLLMILSCNFHRRIRFAFDRRRFCHFHSIEIWLHKTN